jgi:hypothetical protein
MKSILCGLVLAMGLLIGDRAGVSVADESLPAASVAYRDGKITALYETTFQIDHKTYSFAPEAVILDRHGDPLEPSDLRMDIEVKYHLLKGSTDKIDKIILFLPE